MHKTITHLNKTDLINSTNLPKNFSQKMQPSETTINNILRFAANYRVQKISQNEFVEITLS
ncbi:MAG: hypothetical protein BGO29_00565 [Bacteroidales bacterium 36-12]|jgi:hypothetical protein|nr:MAG: hypothetical protein BGO29_00565 [Bacteroidales bacterium 36-12]